MPDLANTITVFDWKQVPDAISTDCFQRLAEGVYLHHRLNLTFVVTSEVRNIHTIDPEVLDMLLGHP